MNSIGERYRTDLTSSIIIIVSLYLTSSLVITLLSVSSTLGQKCLRTRALDSAGLFPRHGGGNISAKIGSIGGNLTISCLSGFSKTNLFPTGRKWLYKPFKHNSKFTKVKTIDREKLFEKLTKEGNETIYYTGYCSELHVVRFTSKATGIYKCVGRKDGGSNPIETFVSIEPEKSIEPYSMDSVNSSRCRDETINILEKKISIEKNFTYINEFYKHLDVFNYSRYRYNPAINNSYKSEKAKLKTEMYKAMETFSEFSSELDLKFTLMFIISERTGCEPCGYNITGTKYTTLKCFIGGFTSRNKFLHYQGESITIQLRQFISIIGCHQFLNQTAEISNSSSFMAKAVIELPGCFVKETCEPELCPINDVDLIMAKLNISKLNIDKPPKRVKLIPDPKSLQILDKIYELTGDEVAMKCPIINETHLSLKGDIIWFKCNSIYCEQISGSKRSYVRYTVHKSKGILRIRSLTLNDSGIFCCVQKDEVLRGTLWLQVDPITGLFDLRTPIGAMLVSTIFVTIVFFFLQAYRLIKIIKLSRKRKTKKRARKKRKLWRKYGAKKDDLKRPLLKK